MDRGAWWAAVHGGAQSRTRLKQLSMHACYALEKEMATQSSVLAWRIPGTEEPGGLLSMGSHRVGHDRSDLAAAAAAASPDSYQTLLYASKPVQRWFPGHLLPQTILSELVSCHQDSFTPHPPPAPFFFFNLVHSVPWKLLNDGSQLFCCLVEN